MTWDSGAEPLVSTSWVLYQLLLEYVDRAPDMCRRSSASLVTRSFGPMRTILPKVTISFSLALFEKTSRVLQCRYSPYFL